MVGIYNVARQSRGNPGRGVWRDAGYNVVYVLGYAFEALLARSPVLAAALVEGRFQAELAAFVVIACCFVTVTLRGADRCRRGRRCRRL